MNVCYPMRKIPFLLMFIVALWSCSDKNESEKVPEEGFPIISDFSLGIAPTELETSLEYELFIFKSVSGSSNFTLVETMSPVVNQSRLKIPLSDLANTVYRFLFVAQPTSDGQFKVVTSSTQSAPGNGTLWDNIRVVRTGDLTLDCYYGIKEMSVQEIIDQGRVHGELERVVGQMVFDFYKTSGGINDVIAIDQNVANSVLDRIKSIEIVYTGMTEILEFTKNCENKYILTPAGIINNSTKITQTIIPDLDNYRLKTVQRDEKIVTNHDNVIGKARILGVPLFPSDKNIRAVMNLAYFDTTPLCENASHAHTDDCFQIKEMSLNLPAQLAEEGLNVIGNSYTVNKAAILLNRVIDVPRNGNITIEVNLPDVQP